MNKEKIMEVISLLGIFNAMHKGYNVVLYDQYGDFVATLYFDENGIYRGYDI